MMLIDPFRWYRRRNRLAREAHDEVEFLRRRHGEIALLVAREKLTRSDLTSWGRQVLEQAIKELERLNRPN